MTDSMREAMALNGESDKLASYYNKWATKYDDDVGSHGYGLPQMMVATLAEAAGRHASVAWARDPNSIILDAGCGTGLVGVALAEAGYRTIDGVDIAADMVDVARERGVYRNLEGDIDLTCPPPKMAGSADIVTVGGVFTLGHVPPETLANVAGLVRAGGLLITSVRRAYLQQTSYHDVSEFLIERGAIEELVHLVDQPYTMDSTADYWAYRVL